MGLIPGIQESSGHTRNTSAPADTKMMLTTAQRLDLNFVQRWLGMITYDTDLDVWKKLITNPAGDTTIETDWEDFAGNIAIYDITFTELISKIFFNTLIIGKGYRFTYDLLGNGDQTFTFLANSENSLYGTDGINIHKTPDGRILMTYYDNNNDIVITEIVVVLKTGGASDPNVFEIGGASDNYVIKTNN